MKIKFDMLVSKQMEIDIPVHWMPFAEAWLTDEEKRTDEQWDLLEHHNWEEMIEEFLAEDEECYESEIVEIMKKEENEK